MKNFFLSSFTVGVLLFPLVGCGNAGPANVTENADQEAIEEYRRLVAESQRKAGAEED